jgi:hypothetical protein
MARAQYVRGQDDWEEASVTCVLQSVPRGAIRKISSRRHQSTGAFLPANAHQKLLRIRVHRDRG